VAIHLRLLPQLKKEEIKKVKAVRDSLSVIL
jgi:hypothetical protein